MPPVLTSFVIRVDVPGETKTFARHNGAVWRWGWGGTVGGRGDNGEREDMLLCKVEI